MYTEGMDIKNIKNLIFDVGDVLIGFRWKDMLVNDFGIPEERAVHIGPKVFDDPIWVELDAGRKQIEEVVDYYRSKYPEDGDIIQRMFAEGERMSVKREGVWGAVENLKKCGFRIYLLSNYSKYLFEKHTKDMTVLPILDGKVISYEVNSVKPEPEIYEHILKKYDLKPEESIFFDDKEENVNAAKEQGISAFRITSEKMLLDLLHEIASVKIV
ncbi:MAG: HAD family phosphatase [Butyrivibrio sp.]|nr:HAD family phosphatase [Butyrivibrio sp.]